MLSGRRNYVKYGSDLLRDAEVLSRARLVPPPLVLFTRYGHSTSFRARAPWLGAATVIRQHRAASEPSEERSILWLNSHFECLTSQTEKHQISFVPRMLFLNSYMHSTLFRFQNPFCVLRCQGRSFMSALSIFHCVHFLFGHLGKMKQTFLFRLPRYNIDIIRVT